MPDTAEGGTAMGRVDSGMECLNCGQVTGPRYCGHCGQEVDDRRLSVFRLLHDLSAAWFSLDSRLLRSLRALALPGQLTSQYLDGKRAPYAQILQIPLGLSMLFISLRL